MYIHTCTEMYGKGIYYYLNVVFYFICFEESLQFCYNCIEYLIFL